MTTPPSAPLPFTAAQKALFICSISLVTLLIVLDYSIANIAIPYIAGGLSVSEDQGIYVITFFSIGNAIGLAMTGWLTRKVGQVRLILLSVALFTFFSWICGLSFNLFMLVLSRFIQGFVAGPMLPLSQALLIQESTPDKRSRDISIWSTMVITGPVLGPLLGGYISYWYNWSWVFYINIPLGIGCFFILWFILRGRESKTEKVPGDIPGILFLCIAVTCFQIFLDKGQQWDWWNSHAICACFIGFIIAAGFFVIREMGVARPFFHIRLLKIFSFSLSLVLLFITYGIYFGSIVLVPLWLQEYMGYDAIKAGIAVCPLGFGPILFSMLAPKLIDKFGNFLSFGISLVLFGASAFYASFFTTAIDIWHIGFSRFFMGLGFICYITPLIQISLQDIALDEYPNAVAIFHFFRALSGAVGASIFTTLWQRRTIFHHERVSSAMTPANPLTPEALDLRSLQMLNEALDQQSSMLAINDAFFLMGWLYAASLAVVLGYYFWRKWKSPLAAKLYVLKIQNSRSNP